MIETFLEANWDDDAIAARSARDQRLLELQSQGLECRSEDLFNILTSRRVYLVEATAPKPVDLAPSKLNIAKTRARLKIKDKVKDAAPPAMATPKRVVRVQHYENT